MIPDTSAILETVRRTGWCRLGPTTDAEYRAMVERLSRAWCETAVELRPDVRSYLCRPERFRSGVGDRLKLTIKGVHGYAPATESTHGYIPATHGKARETPIVYALSA